MRKPFIENSRPLITIVSHHDLFMTTRYFVPRTLFWCPLKRPSVKLTKLLVTLLLHAGRFESCISRKLFQVAISTWIWNGSSIECHEKKHHPFSLSGVRFGSQAIQISGWNLLGARAVENELSTLDSVLYRVVRVNAKPTKSLKCVILSCRSFVTSKQFKLKHNFKYFGKLEN